MKPIHQLTFLRCFSSAPGRYSDRSTSFSCSSRSTTRTSTPLPFPFFPFSFSLPSCCRSSSSAKRLSAWRWNGSTANTFTSLPLGEQKRSTTYESSRSALRAVSKSILHCAMAASWLLVGRLPRKEGSFWQAPTSCPSRTQTRNSSLAPSNCEQYFLRTNSAPFPSSSAKASVRYSDILTSITSCPAPVTFLSSLEQSLAVLWASRTKTAPPRAAMAASSSQNCLKAEREGFVSSLSRNSTDSGQRSRVRVSMRYFQGIFLVHSRSEKMAEVG